MIDLTSVIVGVIALIAALIGAVAVPLLRAKTSEKQWLLISGYAVAAVQAAEIIFHAGHGEEKLRYAMDYIERQCMAHGIKIDREDIRVAIETAWQDLGYDHPKPQK